MLTRTEIINYLIEKNGYKSYLEIGLDEPYRNFTMIDCEKKVSVDPYMNPDWDGQFAGELPETVKKNLTHRMTSDEFFAQNKDTFDIVFIDGLHEQMQVGRDIINALKCLNRGGKIVVHDCLPESYEAQTKERTTVIWNGDVWKAIPELKKQGVSYRTVYTDTGCCVIDYKDNPEELVYLEPSELTWDDYTEKRWDLMNVVMDYDFIPIPELRYFFQNNYTSRVYKLNPEDKDKYIVVCVAKEENDYIREWVEYYLNLGFDKIMIGDNNNDFSLNEVLSDYVADGKVEIFNCHGFYEFQVEFYTMFSTVGNYKWAAYFDCDEFLEIPGYDSIKELLEGKDWACMCFNWLTMSNNGKLVKEDKPVQERFPEPMMVPSIVRANLQYKSIVNGNYPCKMINPHFPRFMTENEAVYNYGGNELTTLKRNGVTPFPNYKIGYIKHYTSRSFEECVEKLNRGYPDGGVSDKLENVFKSCIQYPYPSIETLTSYSVAKQDDPISLFDEQFKTYDIFRVEREPDVNITPLYIDFCLSIVKRCKNKTIIFFGNIQNELYPMLLGYGLINGNKIIYTEDEEFYRKIINGKRTWVITISGDLN